MTEQAETPLPKRFYEEARAERASDAEAAGYHITLDGRAAKTPARHPLATPHAPLADAMAAEWNAQGEKIDPATMPLTQRRMVVIDRAGADRAAWENIPRQYLQSDLLCYRAEEPEELVQRQQSVWNPYLAWARDELSLSLAVTGGIIAVSQPAEALTRFDEMLGGLDDDTVSGLAAATEMTGSTVLALALLNGHTTPGDIFAASRLDETFQAEKWGTDEEAKAREDALRRNFLDVARYLQLVSAS